MICFVGLTANPDPYGIDPLRESAADVSRTLRRAIHDTRSRVAEIQGRGGFFAENRFLAGCEALRDHAVAEGLCAPSGISPTFPNK